MNVALALTPVPPSWLVSSRAGPCAGAGGVGHPLVLRWSGRGDGRAVHDPADHPDLLPRGHGLDFGIPRSRSPSGSASWSDTVGSACWRRRRLNFYVATGWPRTSRSRELQGRAAVPGERCAAHHPAADLPADLPVAGQVRGRPSGAGGCCSSALLAAGRRCRARQPILQGDSHRRAVRRRGHCRPTARAVGSEALRSLGQPLSSTTSPAPAVCWPGNGGAGRARRPHAAPHYEACRGGERGPVQELPFDAQKDFAPVSLLGTFDRPCRAGGSKFRTLADLLSPRRRRNRAS